jgi:hypothetical protein
LRLAHHNKIVSKLDVYLDMLDCRNSLSHIYSEPESGEIFNFIQANYQSIQVAIDDLHRYIVVDG